MYVIPCNPTPEPFHTNTTIIGYVTNYIAHIINCNMLVFILCSMVSDDTNRTELVETEQLLS